MPIDKLPLEIRQRILSEVDKIDRNARRKAARATKALADSADDDVAYEEKLKTEYKKPEPMDCWELGLALISPVTADEAECLLRWAFMSDRQANPMTTQPVLPMPVQPVKKVQSSKAEYAAMRKEEAVWLKSLPKEAFTEWRIASNRP